MTKYQADELKQRIGNAISARSPVQYTATIVSLHAFIDSLTQQPAELTADELEKAIRDQRSALKALGLELTEVGIARTGIAAHKEKQVKV